MRFRRGVAVWYRGTDCPSTEEEAEALTEMIHSINETQVSPEERLSDHPYRYDKDMKTITSEGVEEKALFVCA